MSFPILDNKATGADIAAALDEAGAVIVRNAVPREMAEQVNVELDPHFARIGMSEGFLGVNTQRTARLITKSETVRELILNPQVLATLDLAFDLECYYYMLHRTEAIRLHPGQTAQNIHRDCKVYPFKHPHRKVAILAIWALCDYTPEIGCTRGIPGSHKWDEDRLPKPEEVQPMLMPKGSVCLMNSCLYHGAGANNATEDVRKSMIIMYGLGWLRPLENPYLAVPIELAKTLPERLQTLLGYRSHGYLGHFDYQDPRIVLQGGLPEHYSAKELYDAVTEATELHKR